MPTSATNYYTMWYDTGTTNSTTTSYSTVHYTEPMRWFKATEVPAEYKHWKLKTEKRISEEDILSVFNEGSE